MSCTEYEKTKQREYRQTERGRAADARAKAKWRAKKDVEREKPADTRFNSVAQSAAQKRIEAEERAWAGCPIAFRRFLANRMERWLVQDETDLAAGRASMADVDRATIAKLRNDANAMEGKAARKLISTAMEKRDPKLSVEWKRRGGQR